MKSMIIGCGYTGARLAHMLCGKGACVYGTSLSGRAIAGVQMQALDLMDVTTPLDLPEAEGAVVYYMVSTLSRDHKDPRFRQIMERVLDALSRASVTKLVYLSSTSVYGDLAGAWVDEDTEPQPASPWGQMRLALVRMVAEFGRAARVPTTSVRLPEIYGPGRGPLNRLKRGYQLRCPERFTNRIHIDDLVEILAKMATASSPELLLCCDDAPASARDVYALAAELRGIPAPQEGGELPDDVNRRGLVAESKRCSNRQLVRWLTRPLRYPTYREGLRAILEQMV